jgi:thiopurine S-methyltransferase
MDPSFWHRRWERNEIGFHEGHANQLLVKYFRLLALPKAARVFLPLCGKTRDVQWFLSSGYRVVGAELSKIAIEQLFAELAVEPTIIAEEKFIRYRAEAIEVFVGDVFDLSGSDLGRVDAVYDRAALVALPEPARDRYAPHLMAITDYAPQLLICFEYDQSLIDGPPFSVNDEEIVRRYQDAYNLARLERVDVPDGLKGQYPAAENIWLLTKRGA